MVDTKLMQSIQSGRAEIVPQRRSSGVDLLTPEQHEIDKLSKDAGFFESFSAGASNSGIITGALKAGAEMAENGYNHTPDPDFKALTYLEQNEDAMKRVTPILETFGTGEFDSVVDRLRGSQSAEEFEAVLGQFEERNQEYLAMSQNPKTAFLGTLTGLAPDILATIGLAALPGGQGAAAASSVNAARVLSAARLAAFGTAEGLGNAAMQQLTNPFISNSQVIRDGAIGGIIGGGLGAVAPRLIGGVDINVPPRTVDEAVEQAQAFTGRQGSRSAGAAQAPRELATPAKGAQSLGVASKAVGTSGAAQTFARSPKRVAVDIGARGAKDLQEGLSGNATAYDMVNRLVRLGTNNADEIGGKVARGTVAQDVRDGIIRGAVVVEKKSNEIFSKVQKELFGMNFVQRGLKNTTVLGAKVPAAIRGISREEFETIADELANAEANQLGLAFKDVVPVDVQDRLNDPNLLEALEPFVREKMGIDNAYYRELGQAEVDAGVIAQSDLIGGYRPQIWNKNAIENNPREFEDFVLQILHKSPDDEWLASRGWLPKGSTFDDITDATIREDILDDWAFAVKNDIVAKKAKSTRKAFADLQTIRDRAEFDEAGLRKENASLSTAIDKAMDDLESAKLHVEKKAISSRIARLEYKQGQVQRGLDILGDGRRVADNPVVIDALIAAIGPRAERAALKNARRLADRAGKIQLNSVRAPNLVEQAADIRRKLQGNKDPFGVADQDLVSSSSRFKRRTLKLGKNRHTASARRFLQRNSQDNLTAYVSSTAPQVALRRAFGQPGQKFKADDLVSQVEEAFDADIAKAPGRASDLRKQKKEAVANVKGMLDEFTNSQLANRSDFDRGLEDVVSIAGGATSIALLHGVVISQLADVVVMAAAGGRLGTGLSNFFSPKNKAMVNALEEMGEDDIAMVIRGPQVFEGSRMKAISDMDVADLDIPGGKLREVSRWVNDVGTMNGWVTLMHGWNRHARGAFGAGFANQIGKDMRAYADLPTNLKSFYAKLGIDQDDAAEMGALMNKPGYFRDVEGARIPVSTKWADDAPELLEKYKVAMQAAGDEAMISPSVGDRPFLRSNPIGRLALQFQSFTFTMADRVLAPMIQRGHQDPKEWGRAVGLVSFGLLMGGVVDSLKRKQRGEDLLLSGDHAERDMLWGAFMRGPLLTGLSGTGIELMTNSFGGALNDGAEALTGARPLKERPTRLRSPNPITSLGGPALSTVDRVAGIGLDLAEDGNMAEAGKKIAKMAPVTGAFYVQYVANNLKDLD